jgi:hypothetical protein
VFNEPNLSEFWSVQPFAPSYAAVLRAAAHGIHAADSGATVVLAGLTNESWKALAAVYAAGARGSYTWLSSEHGITWGYAGLRRIRHGERVGTPALWVFRSWARRLEGCAKARGDARRCGRRSASARDGRARGR